MSRAATVVTLAALAALAACSISRRSDRFECTTTADCADPGRVCLDGLCVVAADASVVDARPPIDAQLCPSQCTSCTADTCTIDCAAGATCLNAIVTCPAGWKCLVKCNIQNACRSGVICTNAEACDIQCTGIATCRDVRCSDGPCNVQCSGSGSCRDVDCADSCACDVRCSPGLNTCQQGISCTDFQCDSGLGCSSLPIGCNTCQ